MIEQTSLYFGLIVLSEIIRTIAIVTGVVIAYYVHKDKLQGDKHDRHLAHTERQRRRK